MSDIPQSHELALVAFAAAFLASVITGGLFVFNSSAAEIARQAWDKGYENGYNDGYEDGHQDRFRDVAPDAGKPRTSILVSGLFNVLLPIALGMLAALIVDISYGNNDSPEDRSE